MKICPKCRTPYTDSTLNYCLKDGDVLVDEIPSSFASQPDTLVLPSDVAAKQSMAATENKFVCPDKWLHDIAEKDKNDISRYIYTIFNKVNYSGLTEIEPYIEINFIIINASIYPITIDKNIQDGAVYFNNIELNPKMTKIETSLRRISRDETKKTFLVIKQWFNPELAKRISNPLPDDTLYFNRLHLTVRIADENQEIRPQRLDLPSSIPILFSRPKLD